MERLSLISPVHTEHTLGYYLVKQCISSMPTFSFVTTLYRPLTIIWLIIVHAVTFNMAALFAAPACVL